MFPIINLLKRHLKKIHYAYISMKYKNKNLELIFSEIYSKNLWGKSTSPFFSGSGSHDPLLVNDYVSFVKNFFIILPAKLNALDLGCGDFNVGSQIRGAFLDYTACDIVPDLILYNTKKYPHANVQFKCLDLTKDDLPNAEVIIIRQVLQHLSNDLIVRFLDKIPASCLYIVVTEHVPKSTNFFPNIDKPSGPHIRLNVNSGIDLAAPPFNLKFKNRSLLLESNESNGKLRTEIFEL